MEHEWTDDDVVDWLKQENERLGYGPPVPEPLTEEMILAMFGHVKSTWPGFAGVPPAIVVWPAAADA